MASKTVFKGLRSLKRCESDRTHGYAIVAAGGSLLTQLGDARAKFKTWPTTGMLNSVAARSGRSLIC